ncbi:IS3 family transposase [Paenibacillus sp. FSL H8-0259]|uniref:IS3 family transposase n=1 Tax=Paenibacillus sp. FSL H8-0259 TaxID=1920423 RepID=UPI00117E616A|nr:IS3 family transposase [Paenibacillus sp. FSL H8-0259]
MAVKSLKVIVSSVSPKERKLLSFIFLSFICRLLSAYVLLRIRHVIQFTFTHVLNYLMKKYIQFYNRRRPQRKLNKLTPVEYRRQFAA